MWHSVRKTGHLRGGRAAGAMRTVGRGVRCNLEAAALQLRSQSCERRACDGPAQVPQQHTRRSKCQIRIRLAAAADAGALT